MLEDRVDRPHQVELEVRPEPEDEEQREEYQQDHGDKREPREIEGHDQEVEPKDGQESIASRFCGVGTDRAGTSSPGL